MQISVSDIPIEEMNTCELYIDRIGNMSNDQKHFLLLACSCYIIVIEL